MVYSMDTSHSIVRISNHFFLIAVFHHKWTIAEPTVSSSHISSCSFDYTFHSVPFPATTDGKSTNSYSHIVLPHYLLTINFCQSICYSKRWFPCCVIEKKIELIWTTFVLIVPFVHNYGNIACFGRSHWGTFSTISLGSIESMSPRPRLVKRVKVCWSLPYPVSGSIVHVAVCLQNRLQSWSTHWVLHKGPDSFLFNSYCLMWLSCSWIRTK